MSNNLAGIPGTRIHVDVETIFDVYCELHRPVASARNTNSLGSITETYPTNFRDEKLMKMLQLCAGVPCEFENETVLMYSFVLTSEDSHWRFCFCRHDFNANSIMIVLTRLPWQDIFLNLLATLAELKARNSNEFNTFLTNCYKAQVPLRGEIILVPVGTGRKHNLTVFYNFATPKIMLSIIASLLQERRIIITSRYPDRHSACVQAANALLYPMEWQHTYIPILPAQHSEEYLLGPMPYLIGVPITILDTMCRGELGDVIIFNCDAGTYESCYNDVQLLPRRIETDMRKRLRNAHGKGDEYISYVFLIMMVRLMGQYRDGIKFNCGTPEFCEVAFLYRRHPTKHSFLQEFLSTSMCMQFLNTRLNMLTHGPVIWDRFEMESALYSRQKRKPCCGRGKKKYKVTNEIFIPRNSLQTQLFNALDITESIRMQLKHLRKSRKYKNAKTHSDMRELFKSLRYLLAFAASAYSSLQAQNVEQMNNLGYTEISSRIRKSDVLMQDKQRNVKSSNSRPDN